MKQHFKWLDLVCFIFTNCDKTEFQYWPLYECNYLLIGISQDCKISGSLNKILVNKNVNHIIIEFKNHLIKLEKHPFKKMTYLCDNRCTLKKTDWDSPLLFGIKSVIVLMKSSMFCHLSFSSEDTANTMCWGEPKVEPIINTHLYK